MDVYAAVIISYHENLAKVKTRLGGSRECIIYKYNMLGAIQEDLVLIQDIKGYQSRRIKVVSVLAEKFGFEKDIPKLEILHSAFTVDPKETNVRDDAISIDDCKCISHHKSCKKIGVHIAAPAISEIFRLDSRSIPYFTCRKGWSPHKRHFSLDVGKVRLAVSVFLHTENKEVSGPFFTPITISNNFTYLDFAESNEKFQLLWSYFLKGGALREVHESFRYVTRYPKTWKQRLLLQKTMLAFTSKATDFCCKVRNLHFIAKPLMSLDSDRQSELLVTIPEECFRRMSLDFDRRSEQLVTISEECFRRAISDFRPDSQDVIMLAAFVRRFQYFHTFEVEDGREYDISERYTRKLAFAKDLGENDMILFTSPLRDVHHYVNQQLLLIHMLGSPSPARPYDQEDLLGILGIRFRKPKLVRATVVKLDETKFRLELAEMDLMYRSLYEIPYEIFCSECTKQEKGVEIHLENVVCEANDYCNRNIIRLQQEKYNEILRGVDDKTSHSFTPDFVFEVENTYRKSLENEGTILNLQPWVELRLQVSAGDASEVNGLGLRLLMVGKNCQFCLTHLNHPKMAFMSDRDDILNIAATTRLAYS